MEMQKTFIIHESDAAHLEDSLVVAWARIGSWSDPLGGKRLALEEIFVLGNRRGEGLAANLLRQVCVEADRNRIGLFVHVAASDMFNSPGLTNEQLSAWYQRHGWEPCAWLKGHIEPENEHLALWREPQLSEPKTWEEAFDMRLRDGTAYTTGWTQEEVSLPGQPTIDQLT